MSKNEGSFTKIALISTSSPKICLMLKRHLIVLHLLASFKILKRLLIPPPKGIISHQ